LLLQQVVRLPQSQSSKGSYLVVLGLRKSVRFLLEQGVPLLLGFLAVAQRLLVCGLIPVDGLVEACRGTTPECARVRTAEGARRAAISRPMRAASVRTLLRLSTSKSNAGSRRTRQTRKTAAQHTWVGNKRTVKDHLPLHLLIVAHTSRNHIQVRSLVKVPARTR